MKSIVAMYNTSTDIAPQFTTLLWEIKDRDVFTQSSLANALIGQIGADVFVGEPVFYFVKFGQLGITETNLTKENLVFENDNSAPVQVFLNHMERKVALNPSQRMQSSETPEEAEKLMDRMTNLVGRAKTKIGMPRRSILSAGAGTAIAVSLELLSPNGSKLSAATALLAGSAMTYKLNSVMNDIKKIDPAGIMEACVTETTLFCVLSGCSTFTVASAVGRATASYFPASTEEVVVLEEDGEPIML